MGAIEGLLGMGSYTLHGHKLRFLTAKFAKKTQRYTEKNLCELYAFFGFFAVKRSPGKAQIMTGEG